MTTRLDQMQGVLRDVLGERIRSLRIALGEVTVESDLHLRGKVPSPTHAVLYFHQYRLELSARALEKSIVDLGVVPEDVLNGRIVEPVERPRVADQYVLDRGQVA